MSVPKEKRGGNSGDVCIAELVLGNLEEKKEGKSVRKTLVDAWYLTECNQRLLCSQKSKNVWASL